MIGSQAERLKRPSGGNRSWRRRPRKMEPKLFLPTISHGRDFYRLFDLDFSWDQGLLKMLDLGICCYTISIFLKPSQMSHFLRFPTLCAISPMPAHNDFGNPEFSAKLTSSSFTFFSVVSVDFSSELVDSDDPSSASCSVFNSLASLEQVTDDNTNKKRLPSLNWSPALGFPLYHVWVRPRTGPDRGLEWQLRHSDTYFWEVDCRGNVNHSCKTLKGNRLAWEVLLELARKWDADVVLVQTN